MEADEHLPSVWEALAANATSFIQADAPWCPPPCTCVDCETYYYTPGEQLIDRCAYTKTLTDAESKVVLTGYIEDIRKAQQYLRSAIQQSGDQILKLWRRRTQSKRAALLHQVEPDLPHKKGFMADFEYSFSSWQTVRQTKYRKYNLLPYLDIETLVKNPATLMGLIHTRAKDAAEEWATFDHEQLRSSQGLGLLNVEFNAGAVIMYGPEYGTFTKWEAQAAHRFDIVGFPRARLVIEAQATLMRFLRRVIKQLLEGLSDTESASAGKWDGFIEAGLRMTGDTARWSNFVNQPFTAPPRFDIDSLVSHARARFEATNDHLWLLQMEPSYLKRYMRKIAQMQSVESTGRNKVGLVIINQEIGGDVNMNLSWRSILIEFEHLHGLYHRYRDSITRGAPLPKKDDNSLGALELILVNAVHKRCKQLNAIISQRPGFRNTYERERMTEVPGNENRYEATVRVKKEFTTMENEQPTGQALAYRTERLWWILTQLQGPPDSQTRFRYPMLLDMLNDHLAISPPAERNRLDEILYEKLSDYATLLELLWAIRMHCPRNTNRTIMECEKTEDRFFWRVPATKGAMPNCNTPSIVEALTAFQAAIPPGGTTESRMASEV